VIGRDGLNHGNPSNPSNPAIGSHIFSQGGGCTGVGAGILAAHSITLPFPGKNIIFYISKIFFIPPRKGGL